MKKIKVEAYQTSDGRVFCDQAEAEEHQNDISATEKMIEGDLLLLTLAKVQIPKKVSEGKYKDKYDYDYAISDAWGNLQQKLGKCIVSCPGQIDHGYYFIKHVQQIVKLFGIDGIKTMADYKL